jgi:hypothetical protein
MPPNFCHVQGTPYTHLLGYGIFHTTQGYQYQEFNPDMGWEWFGFPPVGYPHEVIVLEPSQPKE